MARRVVVVNGAGPPEPVPLRIDAHEDGTVAVIAEDEETCAAVGAALKAGRSVDAHAAWASSPWNVGRLVVAFRADQAKPVLDALKAAGFKQAAKALSERRKLGIKTPRLRKDE